jgi:hypothetical protein
MHAVIVPSLKQKGPTFQTLYYLEYLRDRNVDFRLFAVSPKVDDSIRDALAKLEIEPETLFDFRSGGVARGLKRALVGLRAISAAQHALSTGVTADAVCTLLSKRGTVIVRNEAESDYGAKFGGLKGRLLARFHLFFIRRAATIVSVSESISAYLAGQGIASTTIRNGVRLPGSAVLEFVENSHPKFAVVGALSARKNNAFILGGLSRTPGQLSVDFFGDGPERDALEAIAVAEHNVTFLGHRADVSAQLPKYDYIISASTSEGFPNSILEAVAQGVSPLLSAIAPHQELISLLGHGALFEDDEAALSTMLNKAAPLAPEARSSIAEAARIFDCRKVSEEIWHIVQAKDAP